MSILVIDQAPELFWYIRGALRVDEMPLKHLTTVQEAEETILKELPQIVILNADAGVSYVAGLINKIRNHVFARNTIFIVFTTLTDLADRRAFLIAGAGYVVHHQGSASGAGYVVNRKGPEYPPIKFFQNIIKWLLTHKNPDPLIFDHKPVTFKSDAEWTGYGRIGWISSSQILVESNLALNPGETIEIQSAIFNDLNLKNVQIQCLEKNTIGRYYQYTNTLLCKIVFGKNAEKDKATLNSWIKANQTISKNKSIKTLFFETDQKYRESIRQMIKLDKQYCARGYSSIEDFGEVLEYQLPELILINRSLIQKDKAKFEVIRSFLKKHFCYCVTYDTQGLFDPEEFKKNYEFALHTKAAVDLPLLEGMIAKLGEKKAALHAQEEKDPKVFCSKTSVYSRMTLHAKCQLYELGDTSVGILFPYTMSNYCGFEAVSSTFKVAELGSTQFFRVLFTKNLVDRSKGVYHRCLLLGNTSHDYDNIKKHEDLIAKVGFDRWLAGDIQDKKD